MNVDSILRNLAKIDESKTIKQFDDLGVSYGFWGKDQQDPMELSELNRPIQVHEKNIVESTFEGEVAGVKADGVYTTLVDHRISVVTADCLPILLVDQDKSMVMAVHAGWRGLAAGIVSEAVQIFLKKQIDSKHLHIALGPCISQECYEVGEDVISAVRDSTTIISSDELDCCITKSVNDGKFMLDIALLGLMQLNSLGVKLGNISVVRNCTYKNEDEWFSYRRDGKQAGRNYAWLSI